VGHQEKIEVKNAPIKLPSLAFAFITEGAQLLTRLC
jgi:hypothetical protein